MARLVKVCAYFPITTFYCLRYVLVAFLSLWETIWGTCNLGAGLFNSVLTITNEQMFSGWMGWLHGDRKLAQYWTSVPASQQEQADNRMWGRQQVWPSQEIRPGARRAQAPLKHSNTRSWNREAHADPLLSQESDRLDSRSGTEGWDGLEEGSRSRWVSQKKVRSVPGRQVGFVLGWFWEWVKYCPKKGRCIYDFIYIYIHYQSKVLTHTCFFFIFPTFYTVDTYRRHQRECICSSYCEDNGNEGIFQKMLN